MKRIFYFLVILFLSANLLFSLFYNLDFVKVVTAFKQKSLDIPEYKILFRIRIPRSLATHLVGAGLAAVGCVLQSIFLNPLCEGYTLGIASCAGLGVILSTFLNLPFSKFFSSFLGVVFSMFFVFFLVFYFKRTIDISFVLTGVVLNFLFYGIIILLTIFFDPHRMYYVLLWLLGSFSSLENDYVYFSSLIIVICLVALISYSYKIDLIVLGKEKSISLGVDDTKVKNFLIFICIIILSICVSLAGVISFVGVIIPNVIKLFTGLRHKDWIILSSIVGGVFVSFCDNLAKNLFYPIEIPISVFTGIIGSLFFVIYIIKGSMYGNIKS